jgi:curved DNA-binding protein CbpA
MSSPSERVKSAIVDCAILWIEFVTSSDTRHQSRQSIGNDAVDAQDYYRLLGVPYSATRAEITRAYREAMKRIHPDRQAPAHRAAAEERAKNLNRAYSTLAHPESRRTYDNSIKAQAVQDQIMTQYFGGFDLPGSRNPTGEHLRRAPTTAERRDKQRSDRQAMTSVVIVFAGATIAVVLLLVLWGALDALVRSIF